jgi:putative inorganic carbon (HCO3(-)) transporter
MPTADRVIGAVAAAEIAVVVAIAPALLFPTPTRLLAVLAVLVVWLANWKTGRHLIPRTPLNTSLFVLLVTVAVSLFATFDVRVSLGKVSGVVLGVFVFWAVTRWVDTPMRLGVGMLGFVLAGAALSAIGLFGVSWTDKFPVLSAVLARLPRTIRGIPGAEEGFQPNAVAGCLVLFVPLQLALVALSPNEWLPETILTRRVDWMRPVQGLLIALTAGTLLLTQSRGAWTGVIIATAACCVWFSRATRVAAALATAVAVAAAIALGPGRVVDLTISQSGPGMAGNISGRLELWSRALYAIQDVPLTGMGMNTFRKVLPVLYPTVLTTGDVSHAHNHLLQAAVDLGIPGLVAYMSIWIVTGLLLVAVYRRSERRAYRAMSAGLGAGLIAHFTFSITDAIPLGAKVGVLFWLTLAMVVALHRVAVAGRSETAQNPGRFSPPYR